MFKKTIKGVSIKGFAQLLDVEVTVLQIAFSGGICQAQYEVRPEPGPLVEGEPPLELPVIRAGLVEVTPSPTQLFKALEAAFEQYLPQMIEKLS